MAGRAGVEAARPAAGLAHCSPCDLKRGTSASGSRRSTTRARRGCSTPRWSGRPWRLSGRHYDFADGRVVANPIEMRYAWPAELDLMARLAGMRLQDRWGGWQREPFTALSASHVSIYKKP